MTTDAKGIFLRLVELEGAARAAELEALRGEAPELAARVESLLRAHESAGETPREGLPPLDEVPGVLRGMLDRAAPAAAAVGATLGDYELLEEVASGASGVVWRARQRSLDRVVALKLLRAGRFAGAREVERFRAEAGAVAALDHPHIVPVYEVGEHEGRPFFSMKWIEGGSLDARAGAPWEPRRAARLVATVARAVHHAHQRGLLHRDLKPSNVLLDEAGAPHVADFGIAKRLDAEETGTATGGFAGTPAYMAPEQAGEGELTVATDVWALGCVLFELVGGRAPFAGRTLTEILRRIRGEAAPPLRAHRPDAPRDLETIVATCLAREPERRYPSANALADDLERWLAHEPIAARRPSLARRLALAWRRSPLVASLGALVALLVVALAVGGSWASLALRARLRDAWLGEARATRLTELPGRRATSLALLERAARVRPGPDLRDEAIASLALADLVVERVWPRPPEGIPGVSFDPARGRWAWAVPGGVGVHGPGGVRLATLPVEGTVRGTRFSSDGRLLGVKLYGDAGDEPEVYRVLDVETGAQRVVIEGRVGFDAHDVRGAAGGAGESAGRAAVGLLSGELRVHDVASGAELLALALPARAGSLRFAPDGERLAIGVGGGKNLLEVRAVADGAVLASVALPAPPFMVDWSPDGGTVYVACGDFRARAWDVGSPTLRLAFEGHTAEVVRVLASPVAPVIVTYGWDETTRVWDAQTGVQLLHVSAFPQRFTADGRGLGFLTNAELGLWRLEGGEVLTTFLAHTGKSPRGVAFAPAGVAGGDLLVSHGTDGAVAWDLATGRRRAELTADPVQAVAFAPDGALLLAGPRGLERRAADALEAPGERLSTVPIEAAGLDAAGRLVAALEAGTRERVRVLDLADGGERVLGGSSMLDGARPSPDGRWIAAGSWKGRGAHVWEAATGRLVTVLHPAETTITIAFSPDGSVLATGSSARYTLWRTGTWTELVRIERDVPLVSGGGAIAFAPDGARLAVELDADRVGLFDARDGAALGVLEAPEMRSVTGLAFSPDGARLAAACSTNRIVLWDLARLRTELVRLGLDLGAYAGGSAGAGR